MILIKFRLVPLSRSFVLHSSAILNHAFKDEKQCLNTNNIQTTLKCSESLWKNISCPMIWSKFEILRKDIIKRIDQCNFYCQRPPFHKIFVNFGFTRPIHALRSIKTTLFAWHYLTLILSSVRFSYPQSYHRSSNSFGLCKIGR